MTETGPSKPQPLSRWLAERRRRLDDRLAGLRQRSQVLGRRMRLEGITQDEGEGVGAPELLKRLLAAEQQMRRMLVDTPVPVLVLDEAGRIRLSNKALAALLEDAGLALSRLYTEPAEALFPGLGEDGEIELATASEARRVFSIKRQTVLWGEGEATLVLLYDITPEVCARRELQRAVERLEDVNRLQSEFVATASHEFRTPLTGVLSSLELIESYLDKSEGLDDWSRARVGMHLDRSRTAVGQLNELVDDMLVLEKAEGGYFVCRPEAVDLNAWLKPLLDDFQPVSEQREVELVLDAPSLGRVHLDQRLLRYCLTNLIGNALRFSPAGSRVVVAAERQQRKLALSVTDGGPGIPAEDRPRIFEPFYRGHNADLAPGSGLGLAIVGRFVDLLGGRIDLDSEVGRGSHFTLTLPMTSRETKDD